MKENLAKEGVIHRKVFQLNHASLKFCISSEWPTHECDSMKSASEKVSLEQIKTSGFKNTFDCINKMFVIALITSS